MADVPILRPDRRAEEGLIMLCIGAHDGHSDSPVPLCVYLVHWNAPDWVRSATDAMLQSDVAVDVAVVNNSPEVRLELDHRIRVIDAPSNSGYAGGANIGLRDGMERGADYIVIGSHDLHLKQDALRVMLKAAKGNHRSGVLGPMLSTNAVGEPVDGDTDLDLRTVISGTCLMLSRACLNDIGGFDPLYGSYAEDDDICARAWKAGWLVGRVPGAEGRGIDSVTSDRRVHRYPNLVLLQYRTRGAGAALRMAFGHIRIAARSVVRRDWSEAHQRLRGAALGMLKILRARRTMPPSFL